MPSEEDAKRNQYGLISRLCDGDKRITNPITKAFSYIITIEVLQEVYGNYGHIYDA